MMVPYPVVPEGRHRAVHAEFHADKLVVLTGSAVKWFRALWA